jgi:acetoin utilization deacetylase AcuC-like enzyme
MDILVIAPPEPFNERTKKLLSVLESDEQLDYFTVERCTDAGLGLLLAVHCPDYHRYVQFLTESSVPSSLACFPHVRLFRTFVNYERMTHAESVNQPDEKNLFGFYFVDTYLIQNKLTLDYYHRAYMSTHVAAKAATELLEDENRCVIGICEQGGHFAGRSLSCGGHLFNNAAIAVESLISKNAAYRVSIIDLDFNHPCGTQGLFYSHYSPFVASLHGENCYPPYSGSSTENGWGIGNTRNMNIELPDATTVGVYLMSLEKIIKRAKESYADVIIVCLGFNTLIDSKVGKFTFTPKDFTIIGEKIASALRTEDVKILILTEGLDYEQTGVASDDTVIDAFINFTIPFGVYF